MIRAHGMALAPWNVLAGGKIRTDAEEQRRRETGEKGMSEFKPLHNVSKLTGGRYVT